MSKHLAIANLTTRLLEHAALVEPILYGKDLPGFGRHRDETTTTETQVAA
jgi:hypothetical protein